MIDELDNMETLQYEIPSEIMKDIPTHKINKFVPVLIIQSHPDIERIGDICWMNSLIDSKIFTIGRNFPDFHSSKSVIGNPLTDPYLSRSPFGLKLTQNGEIELDCTESNIQVVANGELITTPTRFTTEQLSSGIVIELSKRITLLLKLSSQKETKISNNFEMVGISPQLKTVIEQLERLTGIDEPVLIRGSTGVGKELVAQAIYNVSNRQGKPFVKVNLGAIPPSLAAAELFGTKKGAFTGAAKDRPGFFVSANEGTLFLDEIAEASPEIQSMLLRVLETGELYPLGSDTPRKINVRVIAATDASLEQMGKEKTFKQPLLHRLASYEIHLPSLYERKEDIGLLFLHFVKQTQESNIDYFKSKSDVNLPLFPTYVMRYLLNYHWPGNIRQLKNIARQLFIDSNHSNQLIMSKQIREQLKSTETVQLESGELIIERRRRKPNTVSCEELKSELAESLWEIQATADKLNISRTSIYELMKRYDLKTAADFNTSEIEEAYYRCKKDLNEMVNDLGISKYALTRRLKELNLIPE